MITSAQLDGKWPQRELGQVVEFLDSRRRPITASDRVAGPYPYYGANGVQDHVADYIFDEQLVLLAEDGGHFDEPARGIAYCVSGKVWVNNHAHVLRPGRCLDWSYLGHVLRNYDVRAYLTGTTRAKLTKAAAERIPIPLPPLHDQRRIAAILDQADALRAKRRQTVDLLDDVIQSHFVATFGDPERALTCGSVRKFSEVVSDLQGGKSLVADDAKGVSRHRVLKISAVTQMHFRPGESKALPDEYEPPASHFVRQGDLLMSRANTSELVGALAYVWETPPHLVLPDKLWRFAWRSPTTVEPLYVWALLRTPAMRRQLSQRSSGTGGSMKNISKAKLMDMPLPWSPHPQQERFADAVRQVNRLRHRTEAHLRALEAGVASLQRQAFSGQL